MRRGITALMALLACACAGGGGPRGQPAGPVGDGLTLKVENRNFQDATVYAVQGGYRVRLGRVTGKSDETFTFRWQPQQLQMVVDFTGVAGELRSNPLEVYPGRDDNLLLVIGSGNHIWVGRQGP